MQHCHAWGRPPFEYWNERRGTRQAPERADIEPGAIRHVLGDTFVIEVNGNDNHLFRLAGIRLCALFGRKLKAESFTRPWQRSGQNAIRELIVVVMDEKVGVVASVTGATSDDLLAPVQLKMLLLPLVSQSHAEARVLGALTPLAARHLEAGFAIEFTRLQHPDSVEENATGQ